MTDAKLSRLAAALPPAPVAALPHRDGGRLAAAWSVPLYDYEGRDEGCYACPPASFPLALVEAAPGNECRTRDRLAFALAAMMPGGLLILEIHPGDLAGPLARTLTAACHPVALEEHLVAGRVLGHPDARRAYGSVPRGRIEDVARSGPLPTNAAPITWRKVRPNTDEIAAYLASPAVQDALAFKQPPPPPGLRPLLPPADGHLAQLLGAGLLDGPLALADGRRVVVRGFAGKTSYRKAAPPLTATGRVCENSSSTTVYGERPYLGIRLVDESGRFESYAASGG